MPKTRRLEFPDFAAMEDGWLKLLQHLPKVAGETATNFFKDSFDRQGFIDKSFKKWASRKHPARHKILQKTLFLKESIGVSAINKTSVSVGTDVDYAQIHNEGGTVKVPITKKSRRFFWYMYKQTDDKHWKYMALSKKTEFTFKIPKRQFIGNSEFLMNRLNKNFEMSLKNVVSKHF